MPSYARDTGHSRGRSWDLLPVRLERDVSGRDLDPHLSPDLASHANGVLATEQVLEAHTASFVAVCVPSAVDEKCLKP